MAKAAKTLYLDQLKIVLDGIHPPVWRRVLVPSDITLDKLHYVIQDVFGWTNSHLHCVDIGDQRYGMADLEEDAADLKDERRFQLHKLATEGATLHYEYDYGDSWHHEIVVEKVIGGAESKDPICLDGQRACPPDDVGGAGGYADFLEAIADPRHEQHRDMLRWVGGRFDPDRFDLTDANAALRSSRTERLTRRATRQA